VCMPLQTQVQIIRSKASPNYKPPFTSMIDCVRVTFRHNGLKAPFQGLGATIVRNTPANAVYLGSFEVMKMEAAKRANCTQAELPALTVLCAAGLGGIMYWCVIFPVDVVKSAMQTDAIDKPSRKYPTMVSAASQLWAEGGIGRFYKGFAPCIIRAAPANAAMLYTVDAVNNMLNAR
jgi:solute carrier family 25 (mitochondrial carnitine/acylcarnitine transporter), member 20/29